MFLVSITKGTDTKTNRLARWLKRNWDLPVKASDFNKRTKPSPDYPLYGAPTFGNLIWNALGSNTNLQDFVLCDDKINSYKARIWKLQVPMRPVRFQRLVDKSLAGTVPSNHYLTVFKMVGVSIAL